MIDRLILDNVEPDVVPKLMRLYNLTDRTDVRVKIIADLMIYNQQHNQDKSYLVHYQPMVKSFFDELLYLKPLNMKAADNTIRGFIDTHSPQEISNSRKTIDARLLQASHYASIMLKYSLVHKSKELQPIYIKSIVKAMMVCS